MATPIFSSIIGKWFEKYHTERLSLMMVYELETSIHNYFNERKCIIDKNLKHNICEQCMQDSLIEKDLIGVFRIAK